MLPPKIPIFPLPNVVLFPTVFMPLHIFEPRYREMVRDALEGDRLIGIVMLRPGFENDAAGRPAIYPIGCAGFISHTEPLDDGRYNIVLRGLEKFRVRAQERVGGYRLAEVEALPEVLGADAQAALRDERHRLESLLVPLVEGGEQQWPANMADEALINALSQYLDLEGIERLALLERADPLDRCRGLIELVEMKLLMMHHASPSTGVH